MESKLARQIRQELIAATQALTPEQRLEAFLEHSQLMAELYEAGCQLRAEADCHSVVGDPGNVDAGERVQGGRVSNGGLPRRSSIRAR